MSRGQRVRVMSMRCGSAKWSHRVGPKRRSPHGVMVVEQDGGLVMIMTMSPLGDLNVYTTRLTIRPDIRE
jgi:hypothetical protein